MSADRTPAELEAIAAMKAAAVFMREDVPEWLFGPLLAALTGPVHARLAAEKGGLVAVTDWPHGINEDGTDYLVMLYRLVDPPPDPPVHLYDNCCSAACEDPDWCRKRGACGWFGIDHPDPDLAAPRTMTPRLVDPVAAARPLRRPLHPREDRTMSDDPRCALWYWRHFVLFVDVYDDEQDAAVDGVSMANEETGSVAGVQYSDGSYVSRDDWAAYKAEVDRRDAEMQAWINESAAKPKPATREIRPPFDARCKVTVPVDTPYWIGAP